MIVDFHVHSTASDGTLSPSELAEKAKGFAAIALTDHDNCDGLEEFQRRQECRLPAPGSSVRQKSGRRQECRLPAPGSSVLQKSGQRQECRLPAPGSSVRQKSGQRQECRLPAPGLSVLQKSGRRHSCRRIPGIELSIEPGAGFDKFHLLGLGIDPSNDGLRTFLKRILDGRNDRNSRILANFRRLGIEMVPNLPNLPNIYSYAHGEVLARPHFARWLMEHGFVASIREAFERYLLPDSPAGTRCYEERWHPAQEDAFRAIHEAGGICVMAHPKYWRTDWKTIGPDYAAAERELAALKERGLDGVETLYQANTNEENVEFTRMATRLGYLKTAGSDFHGSNKPTIPLGMEVSKEFIAPVLERLDMV